MTVAGFVARGGESCIEKKVEQKIAESNVPAQVADQGYPPSIAVNSQSYYCQAPRDGVVLIFCEVRFMALALNFKSRAKCTDHFGLGLLPEIHVSRARRYDEDETQVASDVLIAKIGT